MTCVFTKLHGDPIFLVNGVKHRVKYGGCGKAMNIINTTTGETVTSFSIETILDELDEQGINPMWEDLVDYAQELICNTLNAIELTKEIAAYKRAKAKELEPTVEATA
jgi:hypothetical protein